MKLVLVFLIVLGSFGMPFQQTENKQIMQLDMQDIAIDYISLRTKHVGVAGNPAENWIAKNTSKNQVITFTVKYIRGSGISGTPWSKVFTLEPGEEKHIGRKNAQGMTTVTARVVGARFGN